MSKQDYILLADAIRSFEVGLREEKSATHLSGFLQRDNPRFLPQTFISYATGQGGSSGGKKPVKHDRDTPGMAAADALSETVLSSRKETRARIASRKK